MSIGSQSFKLIFNHPVKEFIWCHKLSSFNSDIKHNDCFLSYSDNNLLTEEEDEKITPFFDIVTYPDAQIDL
jgi:hypothetical protein